MELFEQPIYFLYFLGALAAGGLVFWLGKKLKQRLVCALFGPMAYRRLLGGEDRLKKLKAGLFIASIFLLFTALAKPQWGLEIVKAEGNFIQTVIAIDVSASMRARDVQPDRLSSAKNMLRMLITHLKNERIGLIAFTSEAYIQCPITTDEEALKHFISSLQTDMIASAGTSLAAPVKLAAHMLSKYPGKKALILLTDGEDHEPQELKEAQTAAQKEGIKIIAIGIGTPQGELIPQRTDVSGKVLEYKKDRSGKTVVTKLDEKSLAALAAATEGVYIKYTTPAQVAEKVEQAMRNLDRSRSAASARAGYKNRYQIPLALAVLCLSIWLMLPIKQRALEKSKIE
ncbi:MAG: VWA domain-containing protein [Elusimicrobiaceae bacterium]|mgnify:CR=1 FL=1|nr:VWA domain-containing protein [Elusimicrobiaceae bacterium]